MWILVLTQECAQSSPRNLRRSAQMTNKSHEINILTLQEQASFSTVHNPHALMKYAKMPINF